ncbi:MAG: MFS transporter [Alphaproteobacteria bacterium]|nr:MFS transporter [Alphaproteobacteria bacterium]
MHTPVDARARADAHRLSWVTILAYVAPSLSLAAVGMPLVVHLPQFYASKEIGLTMAATGAAFGFMRLLDVFIDPIAGYVSDQLRTKWGRRRPMMALGTPLLALGLWMVFVPGGPVSVYHLSFWLFVMYLGWSMTVIPHLSWGSELSGEYHERSRVYGFSQASTVAGMVGVLFLPAILEWTGVHDHGVQIMAMAAFAVVTLIPTAYWCVFGVPEPEVKLKTRAGFFPTLKFVLSNGAMRRVILVDLVESMNQGLRGLLFFYFTGAALAVPHASNTLLLIYFLTGVLCIPIWIALSRRIGKHRALMAAYAYSLCVAPILLFIPAGDTVAVGIALALSGATYGAPAFLIRSMMADVADADSATNNTERAGLMYSFLALTSKLGIALPALGLPLLAVIGFDPKAAAIDASTAENLRIFYIALPVLFALTCFVLVRGYPIGEREHRELREEIERRRRESKAGEHLESSILAASGVYAEATTTVPTPSDDPLDPPGDESDEPKNG